MSNISYDVSTELTPLTLDEVELVAGGFLASDHASTYQNHGTCVAVFSFLGGAAGSFFGPGGGLLGGFLGALYGEQACPADGSYGW